VGAVQVQEAIKLLHGLDPLLGRGIVFDGARNDWHAVHYPIAKDCGWHEAAPRVVAAPEIDSDDSLAVVLERAARELGAVDALDFSRDVVEEVECPACGLRRGVHAPLDRVTEDQAICSSCGAECVPHLSHSVTPASAALERSARETGLPAWDILWARRGANVVGIELAGDKPSHVPAAEP
jgi:adenylyltransferase/sulfurtransferase